MTKVALDYHEIDNEHLFLLWVLCVSYSFGQPVKKLIPARSVNSGHT